MPCMTSEERERRFHLLETAPLGSTSVVVSRKAKGRTRQSARAEESVNFWTKTFLFLAKLWWDAKFNDDLLQATSGAFPVKAVKESPPGWAMILLLWQKVKTTLGNRPADFPRGAGAIRRQLGMAAESCLTTDAKKETMMTRRGDIWPAEGEDVSLPLAGTQPTYTATASEVVHDVLTNYKVMMLMPKAEIHKTGEMDVTVEYIHTLPVICS